jgi:hypothetical protein
MAQSGDRISLILIATTLLWIVQMLISVAIKEYNIFPATEETQENYKLLAFELLTKILGIFTVMLANWLLLSCSGGIEQTLPVAQLVFLFISMIFAGDYGLPVAYFLEAFRGTSKVNDDLKHYPLYKKTWSHNVVFQMGMYFLFIWVIIVEQFYVYRHSDQSNGHSESPINENNAGNRPDQTSSEQRSESQLSGRRPMPSHGENYDHDSEPTTSPSIAIEYCPDLEKLICGYCNRNVLRLAIRLVWPFVLALVIVYYSHIMKIYHFTTLFFVVILILLIIFRFIRYKDGDWSDFHRQCHPAEDSTVVSLQITFGMFLKVAVWGLVFLVLLIFYQEVGMTSSKLAQIGIPAIVVFSIVCLLHMSDFP